MESQPQNTEFWKILKTFTDVNLELFWKENPILQVNN